MLKKFEAEAALANCRALINQINVGLSVDEPFVNASSAAELQLNLEFAASALQKSAPARESVERRSSPSITVSTDRPAPAALRCFLFEDISSVLKGGVKVCKRPRVNEVLGLLLTEFFRDPTHKGATPIQRGLQGSLLVCI